MNWRDVEDNWRRWGIRPSESRPVPRVDRAGARRMIRDHFKLPTRKGGNP